MKPLISVIMGSSAEKNLVEPRIQEILGEIPVRWEISILSCHRHQKELTQYIDEISQPQKNCQVIIACAGMTANLPGDIASKTSIPVIGVPFPTLDQNKQPNCPDPFGHIAQQSMLNFPKGIASLTAGIGDTGLVNAIIFSISIIASNNSDIRQYLLSAKEKFHKLPAIRYKEGGFNNENNATAVMKTDIPELKCLYRGKVRDVYNVDDRHLLMIAKDTISAFDHIMPTPVLGKGKILNQFTTFWKKKMAEKNCPTDLVTDNVNDFSKFLPPKLIEEYKSLLEGRSSIVKKAKRIDIECVVRGFLYGSAWTEYQKDQNVAGIKLPADLTMASPLPLPMFTPAIKKDSGHDVSISYKELQDYLRDDQLAKELQDKSLLLYEQISSYALSKGIIIADTKFEWGFVNGEITLIDEVATPDSSRFWLKQEYQPGQKQKSYDKQILREYLINLYNSGQLPKDTAPSQLPDTVVNEILNVYQTIYNQISA